MLKIEITDPHQFPPNLLIKTAEFLMDLAGIKLLPATPEMRAKAAATVDTGNTPAPQAPFDVHCPSTIFAKPTPIVPSAPMSAPVTPQSAPIPHANHVVNTAPPMAPGIELDIHGLPWDNRIHSRTKSKTVDGAWRQMRGVDPMLVHQVESELRQTMSIGVPASSTSLDDIIEETYEAPVAPATKGVYVPPAPVAPLRELTPPVAMTPPSPDPVAPTVPTFMDLMQLITVAVADKKLTNADVLKVAQTNGFPSLALVAQRPDLVPKIMNDINVILRK